jgi:hypothetical protein
MIRRMKNAFFAEDNQVLELVRLHAKIVFSPDSKIVTQTKKMVPGGLPVSPSHLEGRAVASGKNSDTINRDNRSKEESYEEE